MRTIELLAPAKNYEYGCAAVDCGADALYVGAPGFGARVDAAVPVGDIARLCDYAHRFGVRVFVTMNTLVFADELREAERIAREVCRAGADALIVQDTAFLRMDLPPVELHASTQMCTMTPDRARFWSDAGFSRIILERAATLAEIRGIADAVPDTGIEAFVHGAICVAYSGQCYLSRSMSPRSGNRGACLQACRLPYDLVDENGKRLMSGKHLLSLRDLNLSQHLDDMANAGVSSFKIEGRLKDINYVRNVVGWYRNRLDGLIAGRSDLRRASQGVSALDFSPDPRKSFSRGATSYYINGASRGAASFDTPKSFGEPVGKATRVARDFVEGAGLGVLAAGDGVCFAGPDGGLVGTRVNRVEGDRIFLNRPGGIRAGTALFRNYDRRFVAALNRARTRRRIQVAAYVSVGPQRLALTLDDGRVSAGCSVDGDFAAEGGCGGCGGGCASGGCAGCSGCGGGAEREPYVETRTFTDIVTLTSENFQTEVLDDPGLILIDFWAEWCQPCRMLAPAFEELNREEPQVKFCRVNVDEQGELAQMFGIESIPTLAVVQDRHTLTGSVGLRSKEEIKAMLDGCK